MKSLYTHLGTGPAILASSESWWNAFFHLGKDRRLPRNFWTTWSCRRMLEFREWFRCLCYVQYCGEIALRCEVRLLREISVFGCGNTREARRSARLALTMPK
jgi:hypothetical protein